MLISCVFMMGNSNKYVIQKVFHVYLNKFENAALAILGNNLFPWVSLVSRNTQLSRK